MVKSSYEEQYLSGCLRIIRDGVWVENERTGKRCKTIINLDMEYPCSGHVAPLLTTKLTYWKKAVAEMLGYMKGYNNAADFRRLGTDTWDKNANSPQWQASPFCSGPDDMGYCYGEVGSRYRLPDGTTFNQWEKVVYELSKGNDTRRLKVTFDHPGMEHLACLPACMHTHYFSVLNGQLFLTSYQRSADMPLGVPFNMIQVVFLLMVMAKVTGLRPGTAYHKIVNAHIYEDQMEGMQTQLLRRPLRPPMFSILPESLTWHDVVTWVTLDQFKVVKYEHHPAIQFPFSE